MPRKLTETYGGIHQWVRRVWGQPSTCQNCGLGKGSRFEWALKEGCKPSRNRSDWMRLCSACHREYDMTGREPWNKGKSIKTNDALKHFMESNGPWNKGMRKREIMECSNVACPNKFYPLKKSSRFCSKSCAMRGNKRASA